MVDLLGTNAMYVLAAFSGAAGGELMRHRNGKHTMSYHVLSASIGAAIGYCIAFAIQGQLGVFFALGASACWHDLLRVLKIKTTEGIDKIVNGKKD